MTLTLSMNILKLTTSLDAIELVVVVVYLFQQSKQNIQFQHNKFNKAMQHNIVSFS